MVELLSIITLQRRNADELSASPSFDLDPCQLCPLCPEAKPGQEVQEVINDDMAKRILGAGNMARWENQKIMDSLETIYCPRKTCSVVLSLDAFDQAPGAPTDVS